MPETITLTADMIIKDVVTKYPDTVKVFQGHGLPCTACHVATVESISGGARTHRLALEPLLSDLNKIVNGQPVAVVQKAALGKGVPLPVMPVGKIKHIIAIMSGKGGVGKSLTTGLLAIALQRQGLRVGILDGDITGPSIPHMFGIVDRPGKTDEGIEPTKSKLGIKIISMNLFLGNPDDVVVWRGPMVSSAIKQFYTDVDWGHLDYLLVDLPPGTSDAPLTVMQALPVEAVVIVSSPQVLANMVVRKAVQLVRTMKGRVMGVVENMAYLKLPGTDERYEVFGPTHGAEMVALTNSPLLAQLPIDPTIAALCDAGRIEEYTSPEYEELASNFLKAVKLIK